MEYIYVGKFLGTHGLKGEIKLKTAFKYLDIVFKKGFALYIGQNKVKESFLSARPHKDYYLVLLEKIEKIEDVQKYINCAVYVLRSDLALSSNSYVLEDFIGKEVYFKNKLLGVINSINDYGSFNYVMEILGDKELLIPYQDNFIEKVADKVYLKNVEGLIDEN